MKADVSVAQQQQAAAVTPEATANETPEDLGPPMVPVEVVGLPDPIEMPLGENLWWAMKKTHTQLFWGPWAKLVNCRGKGLCPLCKVAVVGGADALPPKNVKEQKRLKGKPDNWRLACQLKVTEGLAIDPFPYIRPEEKVSGAALEEAKLLRRVQAGDEVAIRLLEDRERAKLDTERQAEAAADEAESAAAKPKRKLSLGGAKSVEEAESALADAREALETHDAAKPRTQKEQKPWTKEKLRLDKALEKAEKQLEKLVAKAEADAEAAKTAEADEVDADESVDVAAAPDAFDDTPETPETPEASDEDGDPKKDKRKGFRVGKR